MHIASLLLIWTFIAVGAFGMLYGLRVALQAMQSWAWPSTNGLILHSEVEFVPGGGDRAAMYAPDIRYTFVVEGRELTGNQIAVGPRHGYSSEESAHKHCRRYPIRSVVKVYYDPERVDRSVLEPGLSSRNCLPFAFSAGFFLIGLYLQSHTAAPNPSIERDVQGLSPLAAPHVKR